ncbi:unnamed protein product [Fusarium graminearum]|uniref:Chromosome 3, complete genome n=1 Tax=Gibberella zeae (strain ATCC MYA-4620 / CBS 123657 / FGSC 9075 / NRRL 31084 / PH-1) TaxID=229533 RepID=A0A098E1H1_GIBZE|nr:unnamed protein product [Fusarium graminearum]CZS85989.1 unnamed protein product [Fusarium graminearum]
MTENSSIVQNSVHSQQSSTQPDVMTPTSSQAESPILGYANPPLSMQHADEVPILGQADAPAPTQVADEVPVIGHANAPPPTQGASKPPNLSHNQSTVSLHDWQCSSFSFVKPTTRQQYNMNCRTTEAWKERLERELYEVRQILRSLRVSEEEFQAALAEYAAIKHEILELDLRYEEEKKRLMKLEEEASYDEEIRELLYLTRHMFQFRVVMIVVIDRELL